MSIVTSEWSSPYVFNVASSGGSDPGDPTDPGTPTPGETKPILDIQFNTGFAQGIGPSDGCFDFNESGTFGIIGQPTAFVSDQNSGKASFMVKENNTWNLKQVINGNNNDETGGMYEYNSLFGSSVAVSRDGLTVAIAAPSDNNMYPSWDMTNPDQGAGNILGCVYVYTYNSAYDTWNLAKVFGSYRMNLRSASLAISDDGATISACQYVYHKNLGAWTLQSDLALLKTISSGNLKTAISGSGDDVAIATESGVVNLFKRVNGVWEFKSELTVSNPNSNKLIVRFSQDGNVLLVGNAGCLIYRRNGEAWALEKTISDSLGSSVDISSDGKRVITTSQNVYTDNQGEIYAGVASIYDYANSEWKEVKKIYSKKTTNPSVEHFGAFCRLIGNGSKAAIAYGDYGIVELYNL